MATVMITCPLTGRLVSTGIETDPASIALIPPVNARLACPACGNVHIWSILDAELVVEPFECGPPAGREWELRLRRLRNRSRAAR